MIELREELLLGDGGERLVFIHPNDSKKVVKVLQPQIEKHNFQNELEFKYYNFLTKKNVDFSHITKCFGYVDTNFGKGLVFERVIDFDGEDSKFLRNCLQENIFTKDQEKRLLDDLKKYLEDNEILFIDCSSHNVFCKKVSADKYTLIIYELDYRDWETISKKF